MPKHIVILFVLLGGLIVLALGAKSYLTDPSFHRFGNYRADAVPEIAAQTPLLSGGQYCLTCHDGGFAFGSDRAHGTVQCEVCHGVDPAHPDSPTTSVPADTIALCGLCHEAMPARPERQPQVVTLEHPSADEAGAQCHECHDPHSPGGGAPSPDPTGSEDRDEGYVPSPADLAATISKCAKCHGESGEGRKNNPAIAGMAPGAFAGLFEQYASGAREHKLMNKYARELSAEEISGLAEYYGNLEPEKQDKSQQETGHGQDQ